jgi:hypothetical protein
MFSQKRNPSSYRGISVQTIGEHTHTDTHRARQSFMNLILFFQNWESKLKRANVEDCQLPDIDVNWPITLAARSKAWTVFACSRTGIVGSNPTRGMDVCVRLFCVCVGSGFATGSSPVQGVLPTVKILRNWKSGQGPTKGCGAID